jgi:outer membrane protein TolC
MSTLRGSLFVLVSLILGASAAAQQAAPPPAPPSSPASSSGQVMELSMEQAVTMALETNLGLKADRLGTNIAAQNIAAARAAFRPLLRSSFSRSTSDQLPSNFIESDVSVVSSGSTSVSSSLDQTLPRFGGAYSVRWSGNRSTTTSETNPFNPRTGSSVSLSYNQPLLRNFRIDESRFQLQAAQQNRRIADLTLEQRITRTRNDVQQAYLNLIGAIEGLKVAQQNMDLAQETLKNFRARVAVGVSADIEVIQAEAQVASNEESVVVAEAQIDTSEDALRALILDPARADYWQVRLRPSDTITAVPRDVDVDAAVRNALANRIDLVTLRRQQEITSLGIRLSENLTKPDVSFGLNYTAQGTGGTQFQFGSGFPPEVLGRTNRAFSNVLGDAFLGTYPSWTAGVTFSYPLGMSAAKATLARGQLEQRQENLSLQNLELQVTTQVRNAARAVQSNFKRVEATQKARQATERQLDAEQRKFGVGLSSSFELQQRQRDLAAARILELNAMLAYNRALIELERVQKIPAGGL